MKKISPKSNKAAQSDLEQLTRWLDLRLIVDTVDGSMPVVDWLRRENDRLCGNTPGRITEVRIKGSTVAMFGSKVPKVKKRSHIKAWGIILCPKEKPARRYYANTCVKKECSRECKSFRDVAREVE